MFAALFGHSTPKQISRDLKLKIINNIDDPLLYGVKDTLYLAIPGNIDGKQLKERIHGKLNLPVNRIMLVYCGSQLKDNATLPEDVYEPSVAVNLELEVFKPRIHVMLRAVKDSDVDRLILHRDLDDEDDEAREARLAAERLREEEERQAKERLMLIRQLRLARDHGDDEIKFDLSEELSHINCGTFIQLLRSAGFADVVSAHATLRILAYISCFTGSIC
jgi:hypothetical protein